MIQAVHIIVKRIWNKLMARKLSFRNGDQITAGHIGYMVKFITILTGAVISLVLYVYFDNKTTQRERDEQQDKQRQEFYDELIDMQKESNISVDAIKKYILLKDGVDLDAVIEQHTWEQLHEKFKSNPRGHSIDFVEPDVDYSNLAVEH